MRKLRQKDADGSLGFHGTSNVLSICCGIPQKCVDGVLVSIKVVKFNQFCLFKDMSVESKGLHAQNCVCRKEADLCTVMASNQMPGYPVWSPQSTMLRGLFH